MEWLTRILALAWLFGLAAGFVPAAAAARDGSWAMPTIDTANNIRSVLAPIGPVLVFGPNNFPFAFNSASGGDFAGGGVSGATR